MATQNIVPGDCCDSNCNKHTRPYIIVIFNILNDNIIRKHNNYVFVFVIVRSTTTTANYIHQNSFAIVVRSWRCAVQF
uniref:Uncharacterized protein n=1 Tax=Strigamia maritima TaxID=126957 RepID=T1INR5_STRMM